MKLKDNSTQEIDTALYQLEQKLKSNIRLTDIENSNASTAKINAVDKKLTEEVKDRQSADEKLQDNINKEIADRKDADAAIENAKQDKLIAGDNIQIDGNVISATSKEYTAEAPIKVTDGKISLDTVPVNKGGTGVTTQEDINKAFISNLETGNSDVTDGTEFVSSYASDNGFADSNALNKPYKRQFVKVWNYIKDKISSVLGLTSAKVSSYDSHLTNKDNPHSVTKSQVGLGSVVNTGDSAKPVSGGTTKFTTGGAYTELNKKVDKVDGKGLSSNDFTDTYKDKLDNIDTAVTADSSNLVTSGAVSTAISTEVTNRNTAITNAINNLDVSSVGGDGKYISAISETNGKISATSTTMDTAPTANSVKAVTSGGIKTAISTAETNAKNLANATGTLAIAHGGTGQTTANAAANAFINSLTTDTSAPVDADYFISQSAGGGTTTTTYHRRPISALWEYIKGKISSVLGLTKDTYGGKASTAGVADKTVNDISIDVPWVQESGQYVIPLGNIPEPGSAEYDSPYNWDIAGFFSIIRPGGHNGSHLWFEAGHGYSHAWTTYTYLDKLDFKLVTTSIKAFQYNGKWWMGLCIITSNQGYSGKMTITYRRGLPATPTCILYYSRSDGVANKEIYDSIQDIPSSWWKTRTIDNPTAFTSNIAAQTIKANTNFIGNLTGNVTGNVSGSSGSCTGKSAQAGFLDKYGARPTSGNIVPKDASEYGGMRKDVVSSSMTDSGRPGSNGHLLTMFWDGNERWDSQLFISNDRGVLPTLKVRQKQDGADYGPWTDIITSNNIGSQTVATATTAGKLTTARTAYVDLGTASTTRTIDWSGDTTIPVNGVLSVANGGTGADTAEGAANSLIASLNVSDNVPVDSDYFISQVVNGGPFVPAYNRRPISKLWEYIKGKILQDGEDFGYNHIVYDDASLLEWANCTDGHMKKVLVKSGTYNMTKGVDFSKAGTGYVFAENGAVINSKVPIAFTAPSGKTTIHNLKVVCGPSSDNTCAFSASNIENLILYDCEASYATNTITVNRNLFSKCTCYNCHYNFTYSSSSSSMSIKVFYQCYCYNCICKQTIAANSTAVSFATDSFFYKECACISCDAELTILRNIKAATPSFSCYYNCWDRCVGCLSTINVNNSALTVYSTLYGFMRCQHMSSCKEVHTVGYSNIKGIVQCIYISSTSGINGESNTSVGNSCDI